jgi:glucosyl-3-phosphoglycerate synthase
LGVMEDQAQAWFRRRTSHWEDWPREQLMRWKDSQGARVSVVIPARDEESTVGGVVEAIASAFPPGGLVDELVVMDSDSTDGTAEVAARAGATVYRCRDVAESLGAYPGKGEALWKSLLVTTGDILVFVDADLTRWGTHFVTGLLGPLLDPAQETLLVKACYDRVGDGPVGGGRVTELVARPLLNLWWPELAGVAQPLAGEWAASRSLLESLPIPVGYGVELAVLIDTARLRGTGAIAQVDLGERGHRNQPDADLAVMAAELLLVAERRWATSADVPSADVLCAGGGQPPAGTVLTQFAREDGALRPRSRPVPSAERPPVSSLRPSAAR